MINWEVPSFIAFLIEWSGVIILAALLLWAGWKDRNSWLLLFGAGIVVSIPLITYLSSFPPKNEPITDDEAFEHLYALQDYISQTGDTDMYLYFFESMDNDYLTDYIDNHGYTEELINESYNYGYDEGYEYGYIDGYKEGYQDGFAEICE